MEKEDKEAGLQVIKELSESQKKQIQIFKQILLEQNASLNLFSRKNPEVQLNFLCHQALWTAEALKPFLKGASQPVLDLGSGNGFPGLFMAILFPGTSFLLCERKRKKAEFLKSTLHKAKIFNGKAICQRAESLKSPFEVVLSQAAMPLDKIAEVLTSLLKPTGSAFLWQNKTWPAKWPKEGPLFPKVFKTYKKPGPSQKLLLKIQWKKSALQQTN